ncbi:hypothetical protein TI39_contig302g00035 [Zymoseptoria brevis]|uniref:Uncharacterized protein n=1 Tax=Zymoseptoria brevis TaxID=1047168 RepID=A0A0F4GUL7_9PEZI|nr:hypothetical protein TI39_contig302g00035 [Zymoseptoria brevis]
MERSSLEMDQHIEGQPAGDPNIIKVNTWINIGASAVQKAIEAGDSNLGGWLQTASKTVGINALLEGLVVVKLEDVPKDTLSYIRDNPKNTAYYVLNGVLIVSPGMLLGPAFAAMGFTSTGVRAASVAAHWQSTMGGHVAKKGVFATLTSAAMKGYGTAVVNGVVRAGSVLTGAASKYLWSDSEADGAEFAVQRMRTRRQEAIPVRRLWRGNRR